MSDEIKSIIIGAIFLVDLQVLLVPFSEILDKLERFSLFWI